MSDTAFNRPTSCHKHTQTEKWPIYFIWSTITIAGQLYSLGIVVPVLQGQALGEIESQSVVWIVADNLQQQQKSVSSREITSKTCFYEMLHCK